MRRPRSSRARGLARLPELLANGRIAQAAFGSVDFSLDIGCAHSARALLAARSELAWRSRAAQVAAPLDGVTAAVENLDAALEDARHAAELGFGGKMAIHPRQVAPVRSAFEPGERTVAWATRIPAMASTEGASVVDGEMIDRPILERARSILGINGYTIA